MGTEFGRPYRYTSFENLLDTSLDDTSNLPELTLISSNQHVKKAIQNSTITTVDSSVNVSLKTLIEQQAAMSSNIDKLTDTFCD